MHHLFAVSSRSRDPAPVTGNAFYVGHTGSNHCSIKSPEGGQHEAMKKAPFSFRAGVLSGTLPEGYE
jgi:hypothetical protein